MDPSLLTPAQPPADRAKAADERMALLGSLLQKLEEAAQNDGLAEPATDTHQSQLVHVRLGVASSLFTALRAKHPATANHSFRVALAVSAWAAFRQLSEEYRDAVEIAALLHDVGKIGVPDSILMKPGKLSADELLAMERSRLVGFEILSSCCGAELVREIMQYAGAWFDGSKHGYDRRGDKLPLGARMLAIADAFDSMTTDHIYRAAFPRERALAELCECGGTQFDPDLVQEFCECISREAGQLHSQVARRWLQDLSPDRSNAQWSQQTPAMLEEKSRRDNDYQERLFETLYAGVVFLDANSKILRWNAATERLTGLPPSAVEGKQWTPELVRLRTDQDQPIKDTDSPVQLALRTGTQTLHRYMLVNRRGERVAVDLQVSPVGDPAGQPAGAVLIINDASSQTSLEERLQALHEHATRDSLTKLANRAELDRVFPKFISSHLTSNRPCSLIICDIDHFKNINDVHGHPAGDEALVTFAAVLARQARAGDLVARFGGEEFVVLCADCDNNAATRRAEEMRRRISETAMPSLNNERVTASFGVTEIQGGDTEETFLNRADRALLQAKTSGRNMVVQLGTGIASQDRSARRSIWERWFSSSAGDILIERTLFTVVPLKVTMEKLRGFVADHQAQLSKVSEDRILLTIDSQSVPQLRRSSDRPVPFQIELTLSEKVLPVEGRGQATALRTLLHVSICPKKQRDRRQRDSIERARQLLASLKSYLIAQDYLAGDAAGPKGQPAAEGQRATQGLFSNWLRK